MTFPARLIRKVPLSQTMSVSTNHKMFNQTVSKNYFAGTQRLIVPSQTVERAKPFLSDFGITRIANVTGLDSIGIPVTMVCRPNSRSLSVSQGKGLTLEAAKASGLMESIELHHAETITLPLKLASYAEMSRRHAVVEVDDLPFCLNSRFRPALQMLWIEGRDLIAQENVWVPFEMVNMSAVRPEPAGSGCFISCSNGLASGNHLIEAVIHGICEVVERDATTLWHLRNDEAQRKTRVDLRTVTEATCAEVLEMYERAGIEVVVWELTSNTGIPAFQCLIYEKEETPTRDLYASIGMGCHPTRHIALFRSLTEAAQSRLTLIAGSRDDVFRNEYEEDRGAIKFLSDQRALMQESPPTRHFDQAPSGEFETFNEDLTWLLDSLVNVGVNSVIVVDLTKAEFSIPVARVIVPKLESFDKIPGYCPGKRARALSEEWI